ncbi:putative ferric-chelate reductase 1 [Myripristis murdjan]|uniref:putative ferric-chelate reductase 1 n=1 Tax=Myripristis murdjan TaxID=586833 RepID=UPI00117645B9|nr:putative ferric-chelate reductase 1 [Myripristis murdjan]
MERVVLLLLCAAPAARCYSSGQVTGSCADLRPHHSGISPQTNPAPFTVTADRSRYRDGEEVTVRLQAPSSTPFTGFLLQAREVGGASPLGSFSLAGGGAQLLTCNQRSNSAVSHTSESAKTSIQVTWRATASEDAKLIQFHASFVQNFRTFWVDVRSPSLTLSNDSTDGSVTPSFSPTVSMTAAPPPATVSSAGCGITKVCFSQPLNCDPAVSTDCHFMSASLSDAAVRFEMIGPAQGYISFGFSDDQLMGNDDIYICGLDSTGMVKLEHAFSTGRWTPQTLPLGNVSDVKASMQDGVIACSFTSMNPISTQRTTGFNKPHYLMFAHGPSSNGQILFHTGTFISNKKVDISSPQLVGKASQPYIIKAHGALMLIAWMTLGTLGMMVARYLKSVAKKWSYQGKDVWFLVHVVVMSVTVAATITAFILSFSHVKAWSGGAHPVLGCLVMILSFIQPLVALLRCGPHHPLRFLFYWSHALNAVAIKAFAVAAIFTGLKLIDRTDDQWLMKVMGALLGWEALFFILLEISFRWKHKDNSECKTEDLDLTLLFLFFLGHLAFLVALLVGIGMS